MALCHGAGSFPVLCPSVYKFICGTIDEVSDLAFAAGTCI